MIWSSVFGLWFWQKPKTENQKPNYCNLILLNQSSICIFGFSFLAYLSE